MTRKVAGSPTWSLHLRVCFFFGEIKVRGWQLVGFIRGLGFLGFGCLGFAGLWLRNSKQELLVESRGA